MALVNQLSRLLAKFRMACVKAPWRKNLELISAKYMMLSGSGRP